MSEEIYRRLQKHLHRQPLGYPPTRDGVEIQILKHLFSPEEAMLVLVLGGRAESVEAIAERMHADIQEIGGKLHAMSCRGLIMRLRMGSELRYRLEPYQAGIADFYRGDEPDREYARLYDRYLQDGYGRELLGGGTPYLRMVPAEAALPAEGIIPGESISGLLAAADVIAVSDCQCRTRAALRGHRCPYTVQNCIVLGEYAAFFKENGWRGRSVNAGEAREIIEEAAAEGLVHLVQNAARGGWFICNCCSCCCAVLQASREADVVPAIRASSYVPVVDPERCNGCGACAERCMFAALKVKDAAVRVDSRRCLGCGQCVNVCPEQAMTLELRPAAQWRRLPADLEALGTLIGQEKGRRQSERRDAVRLKNVQLPVDVSSPLPGSVQGMVEDVSAAAMFVRTSEPYRDNVWVMARIDAPGGELWLEGRVIRNSVGGMVIAFSEPAPLDAL